MYRFLFLVCLFLCAPIVSAKTILVLGDSLSAAYNMRIDQGWVYLLSKRLGSEYKVVNASVSGETSAGGLTRLSPSLSNHQPDIVILELGANDGLRGLPLSQMKQNLTRMVELSQQAGAQVLLAAMQLPPNYGPIYNQRFHDVYHELQASHAIRLIPFLLEGVGGVDTLIQADGLHPNEKAQPIILNTIWQHLEPMLAQP